MDLNRTKPTVAPVRAQPQQPANAVTPLRERPSFNWKLVAIIVVVAAVLVGGGVAAYAKINAKNDVGLVGVNKDQYQALFLTNGQVYFGKLKAADKNTIQINDIFYLQVQQAVQPRNEKEQASQEQGETQLVKLGEELHGPQDEMYIDRSQVLFWENLKDNGKVVSAIKEFKKQ